MALLSVAKTVKELSNAMRKLLYIFFPGIPRPPHPSDISHPYYPLSPGAVGQIPHPLGWLVPHLLSSRFPPHMVPPHHSLHATGIPHPAIVTSNVKQESSHSDISSLNSS
ncbi:hypothetical protein NHX12_025254 [Muraenolepis orangiensis]|uniref:CTNNB1 binding N-teminal domain-containing protein n=1 Tax=Muraenolepis orangiensis TaxID=630683 RepID=A0A9Q0EJS3_9TELE|nr:hypothetical protein NHX12_025254 [Muraenolepis orangiensis]